MAGALARLAGRRSDELCRSRGGRTSVIGRLSGRCTVERGRSGKDLVRAREVAAVVPSAAGGNACGDSAVEDLRRPRLLNNAAELKAALAAAAHDHGFDCIGIVRPDARPDLRQRLDEFLSAGAHGDMDWLAANAERRGDPLTLWSGVRSIVMLGVNYGPQENPLAVLEQRTRGAISVYAQGDDYHDVIKKRLKMLAR